MLIGFIRFAVPSFTHRVCGLGQLTGYAARSLRNLTPRTTSDRGRLSCRQMYFGGQSSRLFVLARLKLCPEYPRVLRVNKRVLAVMYWAMSENDGVW